jgi:hypothetical protein
MKTSTSAASLAIRGERAFAMFSPFARREAQSETGGASAMSTTGDAGKQDIEGLRRQVEELQQRLDQLSEKDKS